MTWFANYVFAEPRPPIISKFCSVPEALNALYVVKDLDDFGWFDERVRHGLPTGGLFVAREICNVESQAAYWHDDETVTWNAFIGPEDIETIQPDVVLSAEMDHLERAHLEEALPPAAFLRFLKWVSQTTSSVVSFYYCATWGGDTEEEFAWVFGDGERVYRFRDYETTSEYRQDGSRRVVEGAVLNLALIRHGLDLPSGYFALCTRSFNWEKHRVKCR